MTEQRKPFTPKQAEDKKIEVIPPQVIEAFEELIVENLRGGTATIKQDDVVNRIHEKMTGVKTQEMFDKGWLDVEDLFRKAGWEVEYDKPGFNESYPATFTFSKKRKR